VSLGILGGTFDPIHVAHLRIAEEVREALALERVLFVPAADPPWKRASAPFADRLEMVRIAVASNPSFEASDLEAGRPGPSYTVDTLEALRARFPDRRLWFIVGADAFAEIDRWHRAGRLLELASFAVVERPGSPDDLAAESARGAEVRRVRVPLLEISASDLRRRAARGASLRYLVPDAVIDYIEKHHLYGEDH
jgi:nicotinate-nucleotide adenylyltransferase